MHPRCLPSTTSCRLSPLLPLMRQPRPGWAARRVSSPDHLLLLPNRLHRRISTPSSSDLRQRAAVNIRNVLENSIKPQKRTVVFYDTLSELSSLLADGYRASAPSAQVLDFFKSTPEDVLKLFGELSAGDLVVLIQTDNFKLNDYRIRLELFKKEIKLFLSRAVEHVHLGYMLPDEYEAYIDALGFNPVQTKPLALALKERLDNAQRIVVDSAGGAQLLYDGPMEKTLLNIGDYEGMKNVGGTFPVGEVFTELRDLTRVSGDVSLFGFPNTQRMLSLAPAPFKLRIESGVVTQVEDSAPAAFQELMQLLRAAEGDAIIREFGVGLNRAMGQTRPVRDITAFERQQGLHLSLGRKHTVYKKPGIKHKLPGQLHIDMFVDVSRITIDSGVVFENGRFILPLSPPGPAGA